ncbi:MAG: EAL domain-containing protein, partial [Desulfuromonadales bacterium]|nr:EAL domain-containing protein [Desulfuromonadales bacterium]
EACQTGNAFEDHGLKLPIAVNISATLVHERDIVNMVRETLDETGFDPQRLTLELTETYRISNFERASEILGELAALGPKISMDDFGVG